MKDRREALQQFYNITNNEAFVETLETACADVTATTERAIFAKVIKAARRDILRDVRNAIYSCSW